VVIDHNLAFDPDFSEQDFLKLHVFADDVPAMFSDFLVQDAYTARFAAALGIWEEACNNVPASWGFVDPEHTIPVGFPWSEIKKLLDRALFESFWQLPTP
jgi:hypothetical protein